METGWADEIIRANVSGVASNETFNAAVPFMPHLLPAVRALMGGDASHPAARESKSPKAHLKIFLRKTQDRVTDTISLPGALTDPPKASCQMLSGPGH